MKPVTPASYQKIFAVTSAMIGLTLEANRGLLVTTTAAGSMTVNTVGGSKDVQISNIPANTVFVLPLAVHKITAVNSTTTTLIWGLA